MQILLTYCLKFSVSVAIVSIFYELFLKKLTFYNWNRYYLLGYSLLSFFVVFIDISPMLQNNELKHADLVKWVPVLISGEVITTNAREPRVITASNLLALIFITGIVVMLVRLILQLLSFKRMMRNAKYISVEGMKCYQVNEAIIPFSFGNSIFLNSNLHTETELKDIIRHEFVHVKQRHSIDIIWGEILCLLNWYNPFAWLLRASIRQNLEFIADNKVLQSGIDRKAYQYLLLKVIGNNQFSIASKFNFSSLKKRIVMMNKLKSARLNLVRFLFVLPLIAVLLLAFRTIETKRTATRRVGAVLYTGVVDTIPKPATTSRQNSSVGKTVSVQSDRYVITGDKAVIHLHDGTVEEFDLKNKEQKQKFEDKYGEIITVVPVTVGSSVTVDGVKALIAPVNVNANINSNLNSNINTMVNSNVSVAAVAGTTIVSAATPDIADVAVATTVAPLAVSGVPFAIADQDPNIIIGDQEVLFSITKNTTRTELDDLKKEMKEKGYELSFDEINYNDNGKLISISGTMESKDATNKFSATGFSKIVVSVVNEGGHTFFRIDDQRAAKRVI